MALVRYIHQLCAGSENRLQHWLFEAKKRYGLSVLDYVATSNHIHLLVHDRGAGEVARRTFKEPMHNGSMPRSNAVPAGVSPVGARGLRLAAKTSLPASRQG